MGISGGAAAAAAVAAAAAAVAWLSLNTVAIYLSKAFPPEAWGPGAGVRMASAYKSLILGVTCCYLPVLFILKRFMRSRPAYSLNGFVLLWNVALSLLSFLGVAVVVYVQPEMLMHAMYPERLFSPPVRAVITIFTLTKPVEFGDTLILILRKKPVSFLHAYHHFTVSLYCWHAQQINADFAHGFALMNLSVHALMYLYFALFSVTKNNFFLRKIKPLVTFLQVLQMLLGVFLSAQGLVYVQQEEQLFNAKLALAMYVSYFFLFAHLFCKNYLCSYNAGRLLLFFALWGLAAAGVCVLIKEFRDRKHSLLLEAMLLSLLSLCLFCAPKGDSRIWRWVRFSSNWLASLVLCVETENKKHKEKEVKREVENKHKIKAKQENENNNETEIEDALEPELRCLSTSAESTETTVSSISSNEDEVQTPLNCSSSSPQQTAAAAAADHKSLNKRNSTSPLLSFLKGQTTSQTKYQDFAAALVGAALPAVYGHLRYRNPLLAFAVLGSLRWLVEVHLLQRICP